MLALIAIAILGFEWTPEAIVTVITAIGLQATIIIRLFTDQNGNKLDQLADKMEEHIQAMEARIRYMEDRQR